MAQDHLLPSLFALYLATVLVVSTVADIRHLIIPDLANAASLTGAVIFAALSPQHALVPQLIGGAVGGGAFFLLAVVFYRIRHHHGLGLGDAKFMVGAGTWVGWQSVPLLVLAASLSALIYVAIRKATDVRFDPQGRIPFAPFLSGATLVVWSLQEFEVIQWMT